METETDFSDLSDLELDLLTLCYINSNQFGTVDMETVQKIAYKYYGILISDSPMFIKQDHIDILVKYGIIPDIYPILNSIKKEIKK